MKLAYQAFDMSGKAVSDTVEASDAAEAVENLRRQGLYVTEIHAQGGASGGKTGRRRKRLGSGKRLKNLAMFTRQLSVLVTSGTPLVQALGALERQANDKVWKEVVMSLRGRVEEGATLSQAMQAQPDVFDPVCRSLIAAGESSGSFDTMLDRLATLSRKQLHVRGAIVGALIYPALLIVVAMGVLALMLLFVLPRFAGLFQSLDVPLPIMTKLLMKLSGALRSYWWTIPLAGGGGFFLARSWIFSLAGKRTIDTVLLKVPVAGPVLQNFAVARIARVLGVLVTGKVPLLEALGLARETSRNVNYMELVSKAEEAVTRGSSMSTAFAASNLVSPSLCEAIKSGEQSGQMGPLLLNIADFLDEENEVVVKSLTSILEPLILVVLGLVVGFVALSMFLPLFDLTSATHG